MKKKIIFIVIVIALLAAIITGIFFFLNRNKDDGKQTLDPGVTDTTPPIESNEPTPTPEPTPSQKPTYLDGFDTYTSLPGVSFRVPKQIMEDAIPIDELEGSLNGQTAKYETPNTFAIKKVGSFMLGISYYEKAGVYDAMYVSSITGQGELKITEDMSFNFKDINFNSTSFNTSKATGQKRSVISVQMIEPEYTNDTYDGYIVINVNPQNKGYMMFIASTGLEYTKADIQSMVNSLSLTGEDVKYIVPAPETLNIKVDVNPGEKIITSGTVSLRNNESGQVYGGNLLVDTTQSSFNIDVIPGTYQILSDIKYKDTIDGEEKVLNVIFENNIIDVSADNANVAIDLAQQTGDTPPIYNSPIGGWFNATLSRVDNLKESDIKLEVKAEDDTSLGTINLKTNEVENNSLILPTGKYKLNITIDNGEPEIKEFNISDMGVTTATIYIDNEITIFIDK